MKTFKESALKLLMTFVDLCELVPNITTWKNKQTNKLATLLLKSFVSYII